MRNSIRLTENDIHSIVKQVINEITGGQRKVIAQYGKESLDASVIGCPTLPNGKPTTRALKQVATMDKQSIYMMLTSFKNKPFSFVINYQGIDVVVDFWIERMTQVSSQFTIVGTMFMKNGTELLGKIRTDVSTDSEYIKIKGDRHQYHFTPVYQTQRHWDKFKTELKNSIS